MSGSNSGQGRGEISPQEREAIRQRSLDIGKRLDTVNSRSREAADRVRSDARTSASGRSYGQAFRLSADLIAGVGAGLLIGWLAMRELGAPAWVLALSAMVGFAAGLLNLFRTAKAMQAEVEAEQLKAPRAPSDDEDEDR